MMGDSIGSPIVEYIVADQKNPTIAPSGSTIKPIARSGSGFQLWEPGELQLVSLDAKAEDTDADGDLCEIKRIEIESEGGFVPDEGMKYGGPQRLRLTLSAAPEARQFQFRYYFELFGNVSLAGQEGQTTGARGLLTA